jgi:hypothetical protein
VHAFLDLERRSIRVLALLILLGLGAFSTALIYGNRWAWPPIRSDGVGYYAYLPALVIYHDPSMESLFNLPPEKLKGYQPLGPWTGINRYEKTGLYFDKYTMGVALLMLPFFLAAHGLSWVCSLGQGGFGLPYQWASVASALFYLVAGIAFLYGFLRNYFSPAVVFFTLAVHIFGTGLFHYATYDGSFSHVYSFFLVSVYLFLLVRYRERWIAGSVLCGAVLGLIFLTRQPNVLFGLFFALFGVSRVSDLRRTLSDKQWHKRMVLFTIVFFITVFPQLCYWKYTTGQWFLYSYLGERFDWGSPHILDVLFSVRKGLFFWYPALLASTAGFFFMRAAKPDLLGGIVSFVPLNLYIIASWPCWWYGGSLGQRSFVDSVPVFCIGLASLLAAISSRGMRLAVTVFLIGATALTIVYMVLYWLGIISIDAMTWTAYGKIFTGR